MPNHFNERITRLRELMQQGLFEVNLDKLVCECNSLAQDSAHVLLFFTLKNIFRELSETLESGAIEVAQHEELVCGISNKVSSLLQKLADGTAISTEEIEALVRIHIVNRNLFRF